MARSIKENQLGLDLESGEAVNSILLTLFWEASDATGEI
jgi:hypothetical protein